MDLQKAFNVIDDSRQAMVDFWRDLVNIDSGSGDKAGVDAVGRRIDSFLEAQGIAVRFHVFSKAGNVLVAELGDVQQPFVAFLGHMDTVFCKGTVAQRPFTLTGGKAYGPGVLDMKGGVVIAAWTLKVLKDLGYAGYPIKLILVGDEEIAHVDSEAIAVIKDECRGAVAAFNFETGYRDNGIVVARKGCLQVELGVTGVGAHAGTNPQEGRSAIREMAHKILALEALTDYAAGNTVNVGVIDGGTVPNAVPEHCHCSVDIRVVDEDSHQDYLEKIKAIAAASTVDRTTTAMAVSSYFPPMKRLPATMALFAKANDLVQQAGLAPLVAKTVGGASDSALVTALGIPTLCGMGVQGVGSHTVREEADVESLFTRTKMMVAIMVGL